MIKEEKISLEIQKTWKFRKDESVQMSLLKQKVKLLKLKDKSLCLPIEIKKIYTKIIKKEV